MQWVMGKSLAWTTDALAEILIIRANRITLRVVTSILFAQRYTGIYPFRAVSH
jgi:hypothetical protein